MATVTGKTSEKLDEIFSTLFVAAGLSDEGQFTLTTRGGATINAGSVGTTFVDVMLSSAGRLVFTRRNGQKLEVAGGIKAVDAWPVGAVFMSVTPTNPTTLLNGGTWVPWGTGRMPVGVDPAQTEFDTVEETGGSKTVTLTESQLPAHSHNNAHTHAQAVTSEDSHNHTTASGNNDGTSAAIRRAGGTSGGPISTSTDAHTHTVDVPPYTGQTGTTGSGAPHPNLPPYITCYMWKRTA